MEERFAPGNLSCFFLPFRMADSSALEGLLAALQADSDGWALVQDSLRYLLRHVADRLNGSSSTDRLCFRFSLTEHGRERAGLQPAERLYHTKPHTFHGGSTDFPCRLEGAELYIFRTTVCILSLQVSFQENTPLYVAAGQYYLKKVSREPLFDESGKELTLLDMGRRLVDGLSAGGAEFFFHAFPGTERANVLSRVEAPLQENYSLELFHLRHCYHDGFLYTPEPEAAFYQPAQDTVWSVSTEAAACLVCPEQGRQEFLRGTFYRNFQQEYQFMYILLLHQKYVLYRFLALVGTKTGRDLDLLEDYREKLYSFETDYVFSCVTEVPQYQNLYEKLTDAFALKSMFEDVREPLIALREVRTEQAALDQKKRDARVNKGLLVLSLLTLFSALIDGFDFIGAFLPRLAPDAWVYNAQNGFVFLVFLQFFVLYFGYSRRASNDRPSCRDRRYGKMEQVFTYIGCFFSRDAVFRAVENISSERLERVIAHPHVTFVYAPRQVDTSLFGLPVYARVTGYGNDGKNEGLRVELFTADPDLQRLAGAIPLPHITLSVARGGHSVDTAGLTFSTVPPFLLEGRFGGMRSDGRVITTPQP